MHEVRVINADGGVGKINAGRMRIMIGREVLHEHPLPGVAGNVIKFAQQHRMLVVGGFEKELGPRFVRDHDPTVTHRYAH